jgi:hypothetical protein
VTTEFTDFTSDPTLANSGETGALSEDGDLGEEVRVSAMPCEIAREACTAKFVLGKRRSGLELLVVFVGKSEILSAAGDKLGIISAKEKR